MAKSRKKKSKVSLCLILSIIAALASLISLAFMTMSAVDLSMTVLGKKVSLGSFSVIQVAFGDGENSLDLVPGLLAAIIVLVVGALASLGTVKCKYIGYLSALLLLTAGILFFCTPAFFSSVNGSLIIGGTEVAKSTAALGNGAMIMGICSFVGALASVGSTLVK